MSAESSSVPVIRRMVSSDLERIIEIDIMVLGKERTDYWKTKMALVEQRPQFSALVATIDGRVVGFIIGGASRWEYGVPENVGWIDTIGVAPEHQRKGIAKLLFREMTQNLKQGGIDTLITFVTRRDWLMLKFFSRLGFQKGDMVNLELDI